MSLDPEWGSHNTAMVGFKKFIENFDIRFLQNEQIHTVSMAYLEELLNRLDNNFQGFSRSHLAISNILEKADQDAICLNTDFERELESTSQIYQDLKTRLEDIIVARKVPAKAVPPKANEVNIPSFSGNFIDYTAFRSAILVRVMNEAYPAHSKIDIIVRALTGDAKSHVGVIRGSDEMELQRIWRCLEDTYHNRYLLQRSHIGAIYDQPVIKSESAAAYRDMVNRINQNIHALGQLHIPAGPVDSFGNAAVLEMVLRKLDTTGTHYWETTRPKSELPTITSFIAFLEERIVVLQNTAIQAARSDNKTEPVQQGSHNRGEFKQQPHNARQTNAAGYKRSQELHDNYDNKRQRPSDMRESRNEKDGRPKPPITCLMECSYRRPHQLWLCKRFRAMELEKRIQFINEHNLCRRCLTLKHPIEQCNSPKCSDCPGDVHNQALCPKLMVIAKVNTTRTSGRQHRRGMGSRNSHSNSY